MIFDLVQHTKTPEKLEELLKEDISEEGLQILESIARSGYLLSLDGSAKMGEVLERVFYFDQKPYRAEVSFCIFYRDWCELQNTPSWKQVSEFLAGRR